MVVSPFGQDEAGPFFFVLALDIYRKKNAELAIQIMFYSAARFPSLCRRNTVRSAREWIFVPENTQCGTRVGPTYSKRLSRTICTVILKTAGCVLALSTCTYVHSFGAQVFDLRNLSELRGMKLAISIYTLGSTSFSAPSIPTAAVAGARKVSIVTPTRVKRLNDLSAGQIYERLIRAARQNS